ncbi:MAG TPA: PspC domain-containing protein [Solirubrobacteraceae bacterium]|jgi:phage shock protein PspC (stress-responsive transcriptional regulator)|nr:PspC domain-containing protein [Solirubrobacteraceae bacterium]
MTLPPDTHPATSPAPRPRRFLRSPRDRMLGGVCGGLGEYFAVDPILFRIAAIVLALVGGFALVAYPILWIFVPRDDGTGNPAPLPVWRLLGGRDGRPPSTGRVVAVVAAALGTLVLAGVLFVAAGWATAAGGGVVVACVVVALGLTAVAGALAGRRAARWLVLPALVIALPSGIVAAAGVKFEGGYGERDYRPAGAAAIPPGGYKVAAGTLWIDLRDARLAPRSTTRLPVHVGMGQATLIVPANVCVQVHAKAGGGVINVLGHQQQGADLDYRLGGATSESPRLDVEANVGLGTFEIVHHPNQARFNGPHRSFGPPGFHRDDGDRFALTNRACVAG